MNQVITAPDDEWTNYIARMWVLGSQLSEEITGQKMDRSIKDLERLQAIIDSSQIPVKSTQELQALGIVFGSVFITETPHFDWWIVEDEYGKDACVRYKETTLMLFPQTMLSKRIEDGETPDVIKLFGTLRTDVEKIRQQNYPNV